jgi:hypothetical protein
MNDRELDELLNTWKTPPVPGSLREGVRAGIPAKRAWPLGQLFSRWRLAIAGTAVAAVILLMANTSAFSRKLSPPPYIVDSEIILYAGPQAPSGCGFCWLYPAYLSPKSMLMRSYNQAGSEVVLSWSAPNERLVGAFWAARLAVASTIDKVGRSIPLAPELESPDYYAVAYTAVAQTQTLGARDDLVNSGCRPSGRRGEVVGQEVILNYPTIVVRYGSRTFLWMAPELSCFALRARVEVEQQDGSWILVSEKKAVKVTLNRTSEADEKTVNQK